MSWSHVEFWLGSRLHVELWPRVMTQRWIASRVLIPHWIVPQVKLWPWIAITIQWGILTRGSSFLPVYISSTRGIATQEGVTIQQRDQNLTAKKGHNSTKNPLNIGPGRYSIRGSKLYLTPELPRNFPQNTTESRIHCMLANLGANEDELSDIDQQPPFGDSNTLPIY